MEIKLSLRFQKSFRKLEGSTQKKAIARLKIFRDSNGFDSRLKVHKLHGKQRAEWSFSVDRSYRITFLFIETGSILCTDIGTHEELYT